MAPQAPFKQVTRPPEEDTTKRIENAQLEHGTAPKFRNQVIFRDLSAARAKSLAGELSSGAPGVLLQKAEYAKVVLQHRHLPSENGHVDVVEFTDPGCVGASGAEAFLRGLAMTQSA